MKKIKKFFIPLIVLILCSCNKKNFINVPVANDLNITRFSITDDLTGKRYSGIFNENKEVLFFAEGIIYPFKGGYSYIHKNRKENTVIDTMGETYTSFELSEVYDHFYGYGYYSTYDGEKDRSYIIDKNGNYIKDKNLTDISENIGIIRKNKKMTYFNIQNGSYLKNNQFYDICYSFHNGVAKVGKKLTNQIAYNETYRYGLVDNNGVLLLPCEFSYIDYTHPKCVTVSKTCEDPLWDRKAEFGLLDLNNNWIIEPNFHYVLPIADSLVALWIVESNNEYWVLYNYKTKEEKRINPNYSLIDNINIFTRNNGENTILFFDLDKEKYGLLNSDGDIVLGPICEKIESYPDNHFYQILINGKWMLFKEDEGVLDPKKYLNFEIDEVL